ncbi:MAG: ATP-binding protein [Candidatus Omnitrophica bacterium]|nr:ATP-binding protein [Candidatus Omnitrophota bacterium]
MVKKEVDTIDAVPSKRIFLSIIADYDLNRSICELIDNALDIWVKIGRKRSLEIHIDIDKDRQLINVSDSAGGIKKSELNLIVGPGQTSNLPTDETIGIFGVGSKRAVVALSQDIRIITRYAKEKTYSIEFDETWLDNDDWELPVYEVDQITEGTTRIELHKLRFVITDGSLKYLREHLEATYAKFLFNKQLKIQLNADVLKPHIFENWAYPPEYLPHRYHGDLPSAEGKVVKVEVLAGLSMESSPASGEYGVYFYCNDRLIAKALKNYEVGFTKGLAGRPHPSISLTRVIVSLKGEADLMPWNSSKSGINQNHPIFVALRGWLVQVVKDFASLSRRWEGDWSDKVFKYPSGHIVAKKIDNFPEAKRSYLPPLPKANLRYSDIIKQANRKIAKDKPWTSGLYEGMIAVDIIYHQKLEQKNRICLILLDSTLEIAFKEYLVNESRHHYTDRELLDLFNARHKVEKEIKKYVKISEKLWKKINHYYGLRCKLIHERATVGIDERQIEDYQETVQKVLKKLFKLQL